MVTENTHNKIIENDLKSILSEFSNSKPNRIKSSTRIREDLGIDSFTALEILVAIENKYKIKLTESELNKLSVFEDVVNFISMKKMNSASSV